jgi:hypothetical protein
VPLLGLVHDRGWDPPPDDPGGPRRPLPHLPWRPFAWLAAWCWLLFAAGAVGGLAGYLIVLLAVTLGCWRVERWCARQYWGGLREYRQ